MSGLVSNEMQELSLFLKSGKVDLENEHLFLCVFDQNDVQFGCGGNGKLEEGYSWMKGYVDRKLFHIFLLGKVLKILTGNEKFERRLDFHNYALPNFNYERLSQVFVKVGIYL